MSPFTISLLIVSSILVLKTHSISALSPGNSQCYSLKFAQVGKCLGSRLECVTSGGTGGGSCGKSPGSVCCVFQVSKRPQSRSQANSKIQLAPALNHLSLRRETPTSNKCIKFKCDSSGKVQVNQCGEMVPSEVERCQYEINRVPAVCGIELELLTSLTDKCGPGTGVVGTLSVSNGRTSKSGFNRHDFCQEDARGRGKRVALRFYNSNPITMIHTGQFGFKVMVTYLCCSVHGVSSYGDICCPGGNGKTTEKTTTGKVTITTEISTTAAPEKTKITMSSTAVIKTTTAMPETITPTERQTSTTIEIRTTTAAPEATTTTRFPNQKCLKDADCSDGLTCRPNDDGEGTYCFDCPKTGDLYSSKCRCGSQSDRNAYCQKLYAKAVCTNPTLERITGCYNCEDYTKMIASNSLAIGPRPFYEEPDEVDRKKALYSCGYSEGWTNVKYESTKEIFEVWCSHYYYGYDLTLYSRGDCGPNNFNRSWQEYVNGFGNPVENVNMNIYGHEYTVSTVGFYWIGLERLHRITSNIKIPIGYGLGLINQEGSNVFGYFNFYVAGRDEGYRLDFYKGYDTCSKKSIGEKTSLNFYTYDKDNAKGCAKIYGSGFWYSDDGDCFPTTPYAVFPWLVIRLEHNSGTSVSCG